jgi:hypothetical protein
MRFTSAWIVLLIGGCTVTIDTIEENDTKYEFDTSRSVEDTANCLVRNAESAGDSISGQVQPGATSASRDVTIRVPGGPVSRALVAPTNFGSTVTMWVRRSFEAKGFAERLKEGC